MPLPSSTQTQEMSEDTPTASSSARPFDELNGVLPLSYKVLTNDDDRRDALRLVADSIAQQRQVASAAIIFHPLCLAVLVSICAATYRQFEQQGLGTLMTMLSGVGIMYLATIRYFTTPYIQMAEAFRWKSWSTGPDGREDVVASAVYGEEIIGALVLRLQPQQQPGQPRAKDRTGRRNGQSGRGIIRAWTTRLRYRGKGVGSDLLQFAVQLTREEFGPEAGVEFAPDHANSVNPLYDMFNKSFERRQERAVQALACALETGDLEK